MRIAPDGHFVRSDIWREGKWLDLWSGVHFLSGMSMGFVASLLHYGIWPSLIIGLLLLVAYEMFEALAKIEETPQNRFMDVVVGMTSFVPTYIFLAPPLAGRGFLIAFSCTLALNCTLAFFGWKASRKAYRLERKLRQEYEHKRAQLAARVKRER